jgi:hypothetical protein
MINDNVDGGQQQQQVVAPVVDNTVITRDVLNVSTDAFKTSMLDEIKNLLKVPSGLAYRCDHSREGS